MKKLFFSLLIITFLTQPLKAISSYCENPLRPFADTITLTTGACITVLGGALTLRSLNQTLSENERRVTFKAGLTTMGLGAFYLINGTFVVLYCNREKN